MSVVMCGYIYTLYHTMVAPTVQRTEHVLQVAMIAIFSQRVRSYGHVMLNVI